MSLINDREFGHGSCFLSLAAHTSLGSIRKVVSWASKFTLTQYNVVPSLRLYCCGATSSLCLIGKAPGFVPLLLISCSLKHCICWIADVLWVLLESRIRCQRMWDSTPRLGSFFFSPLQPFCVLYMVRSRRVKSDVSPWNCWNILKSGQFPSLRVPRQHVLQQGIVLWNFLFLYSSADGVCSGSSCWHSCAVKSQSVFGIPRCWPNLIIHRWKDGGGKLLSTD